MTLESSALPNRLHDESNACQDLFNRAIPLRVGEMSATETAGPTDVDVFSNLNMFPINIEISQEGPISGMKASPIHVMKPKLCSNKVGNDNDDGDDDDDNDDDDDDDEALVGLVGHLPINVFRKQIAARNTSFGVMMRG